MLYQLSYLANKDSSIANRLRVVKKENAALLGSVCHLPGEAFAAHWWQRI